MGQMNNFAAQYQFTDGVVPVALTGVTNELATTRIRDGQGPSISWALGHLLFFRNQAIALLGGTSDDSFARFVNGGATDGSNYPDISELRETWERVGKELSERLADLTDDQLARPSGSGAGPHGEKTLFDELVFLVWHEAYHLGTIGSIRPALGLRPTAELVVEAAAGAEPS